MTKKDKRIWMAEVVALFAMVLMMVCAAQVEQQQTLVHAKEQPSADLRSDNLWERDEVYSLAMDVPRGTLNMDASYQVVVSYPFSVEKGEYAWVSIEVMLSDTTIRGAYRFKAAESLNILHGLDRFSPHLIMDDDEIVVRFFTAPTLEDYLALRQMQYERYSYWGHYTVKFKGYGMFRSELCDTDEPDTYSESAGKTTARP